MRGTSVGPTPRPFCSLLTTMVPMAIGMARMASTAVLTTIARLTSKAALMSMAGKDVFTIMALLTSKAIWILMVRLAGKAVLKRMGPRQVLWAVHACRDVHTYGVCPPWRQLRSKWMVYVVNSHTMPPGSGGICRILICSGLPPDVHTYGVCPLWRQPPWRHPIFHPALRPLQILGLSLPSIHPPWVPSDFLP